MHAIRFILLLVHRFHKTGRLHGIHSDSCHGVCTENVIRVGAREKHLSSERDDRPDVRLC